MDKNFLLKDNMQSIFNVRMDGETITVDYSHDGIIESVITKVGSKDVFNFLEEVKKCIDLLKKKENECSEEPTQVLNCKFLCLAERLSPINGANLFTYGKIYEVKDGYVVSDDFSVFPFLGGPLKDIDDLKSYFCWDGYDSRIFKINNEKINFMLCPDFLSNDMTFREKFVLSWFHEHEKMEGTIEKGINIDKEAPNQNESDFLNCCFLCLTSKPPFLTKGVIYEVKDGHFIPDDNVISPIFPLGAPLKDIDDLKSYFCWDGYDSRGPLCNGRFCGRKINFVPLSSEYKTIIKKFEKSDENTTVFQTFSQENSGLNTKFICLEDGIPNFTAGKIYTVANGKFLDDKKDVLYPIGFCLKNITDLKDYLGFAIEELKLGYKYE